MKKIILIILLLTISICLSGCLKKDSMENITIYTTVYPIEYITNNIYNEHSSIYSVYPNNININKYTLTDKQLTDYSDAHLFIYNGLSNESEYAIAMLNKNKKLKIIDATISMEYINNIEELWLDPSNFLMLTQNIKNGFKEYITNPYLKNEIEDNYEDLKIKISEIDAELKLIAENAIDKTLVVDNDVFKFLEKYNFNVISLENNDDLTDKKIADVKELINNQIIKYIYVTEEETNNEVIQNLINNYNIELLILNTLDNLTEEEYNNKIDFIQIMNNNIDLLKNELYN